MTGRAGRGILNPKKKTETKTDTETKPNPKGTVAGESRMETEKTNPKTEEMTSGKKSSAGEGAKGSDDGRLAIVYRDNVLCVCVKPAGLATESAQPDADTVARRLARQLSSDRAAKDNGGALPYVGTVHRLDQVTAGLMVFSLSPKITGKLSESFANRLTEKEYWSVVCGVPTPESGEMKDLLFRDASANKTYVVRRMRRGVRPAELTYRTLATCESGFGLLSLVSVRLGTGRTHQIRVQFASRQMPLFGDGKYGFSKGNAAGPETATVALLARRLAFVHPVTNRNMEFSLPRPEGFPWTLFADVALEP